MGRVSSPGEEVALKVDKLKEKIHPNRNLKYQIIKWNRSKTDGLGIKIETQGINAVRRANFHLEDCPAQILEKSHDQQ